MGKIYDMAVIGGGPAGYTAALYGARAGMDVVVLEKLSAGGQMALTDQIDNYPGVSEADGFELGQRMEQQAQNAGADTELVQVQDLKLEGAVKKIRTDDEEFLAKTVVIATGAAPRELGLPGEKELVNKGVHYCAHCDGMFYRGKTVAVVGGGNSAAEDALQLSRVAKKVILIHRRDTLRAAKVYHDALKNAPNAEIYWNSAVTQLLYDERLTGIKIKDLRSGEETALEIDGLFVSVGRVPASELVKDQLELDEGGYIVAGESTETSLPGVYAVGDVRTKALRQIVTAVADGAMAAYCAEIYLAENPASL